MSGNFIVVGLPRSRTAWLAKFLSYDQVRCQHEPSLRFESIIDLDFYFSDPHAAASDCMMTWLWRDILKVRPAARFVVIRRPRIEVEASLAKLGITLPSWFLEKMDRRLDEIVVEAGRGRVMRKAFHELAEEDHCRDVFQYCLGREFDPDWWAMLKDANIQSNIKATLEILKDNDSALGRIFGPRYGD